MDGLLVHRLLRLSALPPPSPSCFNEPLRGSLLVLLGTGFLLIGWAAALGAFVSAKTKSQFLCNRSGSARLLYADHDAFGLHLRPAKRPSFD